MNTDVIVVACKLPAGLIVEVGTLGQDDHYRVEVSGPNTALRTGRPGGLIVGGYAFTPVRKDAWVEFVRTHKNAAYLKSRAVYGEDTLDKAQAAALTDGRTVLGFERLDPDKLPQGLEADAEHLKNAKLQAHKLNAGLPE